MYALLLTRAFFARRRETLFAGGEKKERKKFARQRARKNKRPNTNRSERERERECAEE